MKENDADRARHGLVSAEFRVLGLVEAERSSVALPDAEQFVASLVDFALLEENFICAVLLGDEQRAIRFWGRGQRRDCLAIAERRDALVRRSELMRRCLRGFETLLVLRKPVSEVHAFMLSSGYAVEGESTVGSGRPHDVLGVPLNADLVEKGLGIVDVKRGECVCLPCHDADPVYLIGR